MNQRHGKKPVNDEERYQDEDPDVDADNEGAIVTETVGNVPGDKLGAARKGPSAQVSVRETDEPRLEAHIA
jgi:hypothetical protein